MSFATVTPLLVCLVKNLAPLKQMVLKADKIKTKLTAKRTDRFALRVRRLGVAAIVSFRQFGQGRSGRALHIFEQRLLDAFLSNESLIHTQIHRVARNDHVYKNWPVIAGLLLAHRANALDNLHEVF